jgi:hypothetical protein
MTASSHRVAAFLGELGLDVRVDADAVWTSVPCARRGPIAVRIVAGERTATFRAFVMRAPDRAHEDVYRRMLRKNDDAGAWTFALDALGDVFLVCTRELQAVDADTLDGILGALSTLVDETFEGLVRTGFAIPPEMPVGPPPR